MANLKVTQVKSAIGGKQNQRDTLRTLGLKRSDSLLSVRIAQRSAASSLPWHT